VKKRNNIRKNKGREKNSRRRQKKKKEIKLRGKTNVI
jgi:hypothetical protein